MDHPQDRAEPIMTDASGKRRFVCRPVAVLAFIVNADEQFLLFSHPNSGDRWEVVNGALDADETPLDGLLREVGEEAGDRIKVRPLAVLHAFNHSYDQRVRYLLSLCYLLAYEGGAVIPGHDMAGSAIRWASLAEIEGGTVELVVPRVMPWMFRHAVELYRLLKDAPPRDLETPTTLPGVKYPKEYD